MKTTPSRRKERRVLLDRARRAHIAGDAQAGFVIPSMEYLLDDAEKEASAEREPSSSSSSQSRRSGRTSA